MENKTKQTHYRLSRVVLVDWDGGRAFLTEKVPGTSLRFRVFRDGHGRPRSEARAGPKLTYRDWLTHFAEICPSIKVYLPALALLPVRSPSSFLPCRAAKDSRHRVSCKRSLENWWPAGTATLPSENVLSGPDGMRPRGLFSSNPSLSVRHTGSGPVDNQ